MRTLFLEAKSDIDIMPVLKKALSLLGKKVGLVATIQHLHKLDEAVEFLENNGRRAVIAGQILGCDVSAAEKIKGKVDCFLYVGSGEFHPIAVALETKKKTVIANPISNSVSKVSKEHIEKIEKKRKGNLQKFLSSQKIGILVSIKPGQNNLKVAFELKKKLEKKGKECFVFIFDTLDFSQLENFNFIQSWVNTACPRIEEDKLGILNYGIAIKSV